MEIVLVDNEDQIPTDGDQWNQEDVPVSVDIKSMTASLDASRFMLQPEREQEHGRYLIHLTVLGSPVKGTKDVYQATLRFYEIRGHSPGINDISVYVCEYCFGVLPPELLQFPICMHCNRPLRTGEDEGPLFEQVFSSTLGDIAETVASHFRIICLSNADILVRRSKHDGKVGSLKRLAHKDHDLTRSEHERYVRHVLESKETVGYSLGRINQDLIAGKSLRSAILDMLRA